MLPLKYKQYIVEIHNEFNYNINSTKNTFQYDFAYGTKETELYQPSSKHGIRVYKNNTYLRSVLVYANGGASGIHINSAIIDNNNILICCGDFIFCLSLPNLNLIWKTKADDATCFGIYILHNDYIIHGELNITKINQNGEIQWSVSGADIFTTTSEKEIFEIRKDYIMVKDWNGNEYWIDFNGKIIYDTVRKP